MSRFKISLSFDCGNVDQFFGVGLMNLDAVAEKF